MRTIYLCVSVTIFLGRPQFLQSQRHFQNIGTIKKISLLRNSSILSEVLVNE